LGLNHRVLNSSWPYRRATSHSEVSY